MKKFVIQDREIKEEISYWDSLEDAKIELEEMEQIDKALDIYTPDFYEIVEVDSKEETKTTIPTELVQSLRHKIYLSLMQSSKRYEYDDDGNETEIEFGMAEMGLVEDEADRIVNEWLDENNLVEIEHEPILTND
jgi:hypothetical protein